MDVELIIELLQTEISKLNNNSIDEFSSDTLSKIGIRLASYKAGLGNYVASAKAETWKAEKSLSELKATVYQELRDSGKSQRDAEMTRGLDPRIMEASDKYCSVKETEDRLVGLSYNISDLIDAIKSRLIHQQMELKESNVF